VGSIALIVNPFASTVTEDRMARIAATLETYAEVEILRTERPLHARELARERSAHVDAIAVYSGDGGFNEALNGLEGETPIGFLPGGGANVLSRALGLPRDPIGAASAVGQAFVAGQTRRITVGRVNGRRFGFAAGLGLDAELVRRVDAWGRSHDGRRPNNAVFALEAARAVAAHRARFEPRLEVVGLGRAAFALVANCDPYTYLGPVPLHIAPEARFELGLDVVAPREVRPSGLPRFISYAFRGRGQTTADDVLYGHDLDRLEIRCSTPMPLQVDGEDLGDVDEAIFEAEREAVVVLTPGSADGTLNSVV
jgi:diacylglycerol kinase family enzyme